MLDAADVPNAQDRIATTRRLPLEVRAVPSEYIRIWFTNLALTILTLGIYSAWAKVRTRRYLYGNTYLDGHAFDYHARPLAILRGRLIAALLVATYGGASLISPLASAIVALVLLPLWPWVFNAGLRFDAAMTSHRGLRFGFRGSYWSAFGLFILWPIAAGVTLGLLAPYMLRATRRYVAENYRYGGTDFSVEDMPVGSFYVAVIKGLLVGVVFTALAILPGALIQIAYYFSLEDLRNSNMEASRATILFLDFAQAAQTFLYPLAVVVALLVFSRVISALCRNIMFNHLELGPHRFRSTLSGWTIGWIQFTNLIASVVSLGMLVPWAQIRMMRAIAARTVMLAASDLDEFVAGDAGTGSVAGAEIASFEGIEIGFG